MMACARRRVHQTTFKSYATVGSSADVSNVKTCGKRRSQDPRPVVDWTNPLYYVLVVGVIVDWIRVFRENAFVSEYDAGSFAGVVSKSC